MTSTQLCDGCWEVERHLAPLKAEVRRLKAENRQLSMRLGHLGAQVARALHAWEQYKEAYKRDHKRFTSLNCGIAWDALTRALNRENL